jgi:hemoglobin
MTASLYERLGGREKIQAVVEDLVRLHLDNPQIATRFRKTDIEALKQHVCEFFCAGVGGSEAYTGRNLLEAHAGMNINEVELIAAIDDGVKAMTKNGIAAAEQNEVVAILYSLKGDVMHV